MSKHHVFPYGTLPDGRPVRCHVLQGEGGLTVEILTYGGIITRMVAPDWKGTGTNVVVSKKDLAAYVLDRGYYGALVGRVAGRIAGAHGIIDGHRHQLDANENGNHLHGGFRGFHQALWQDQVEEAKSGTVSLTLSHRSPHGESGYPGNVEVTVQFQITPNNTLIIRSQARSDLPTALSMTQHSYFNLAGHGSLSQHTLELKADRYDPFAQEHCLSGAPQSVNANNDFRRARGLGEAVPLLEDQHGDLYFLPPSPQGVLLPCAQLHDPHSGRTLTVYSNEDCLQLYVGTALSSHDAGVCLECEGYPEGLRYPQFGDILLRPGQVQRRCTVYAFSSAPPGQAPLFPIHPLPSES